MCYGMTASGFVTDFDFSPFHDNLLATGAEDCYVKLWQIPEGGVNGTMTTPTSSLPPMEVYMLSTLCLSVSISHDYFIAGTS